MKQHLKIKNILRLYILISLVGAAPFSPPFYSVLPLVFIGLIIFIWLRNYAVLDLAASYSFVFIMPLLFVPTFGTYLPALLSLPLLAYVDILLRSGADRCYLPDSTVSYRPTQLSVILLVSSGAAGLLAFLLGNWTLGLAVIASLLYFTVVGALIVYGIPQTPLWVSKTFFRVLAGNQTSGKVEILNLTKLSGYIYLDSPYSWVKVTPLVLPLVGPKVYVTISMVPLLAGPAIPELYAVVVDQWGLSQVKIRLEPVQLNVIPRARYAAWLAKKYLETASPGMVFSQTLSPRLGGAHTTRKGGEFYGARDYQAGDNLKSIEWKHSEKLGKLVVQEFTETHTKSPLLVVNLAASDKEEADRLTFSVITAALTLAKQDIPAAIAAYNDFQVVEVTDILSPIKLVRSALALSGSICFCPAATRYLQTADLSRLRINQERLMGIQVDSAQKLAQLLSLEYAALKASVALNPATIAVTRGLARTKQVTQLLVISGLNHDAEALMLLASNVSALGLKALFLEVGRDLPRGHLAFHPGSHPANRSSFLIHSKMSK